MYKVKNKILIKVMTVVNKRGIENSEIHMENRFKGFMYSFHIKYNSQKQISLILKINELNFKMLAGFIIASCLKELKLNFMF